MNNNIFKLLTCILLSTAVVGCSNQNETMDEASVETEGYDSTEENLEISAQTNGNNGINNDLHTEAAETDSDIFEYLNVDGYKTEIAIENKFMEREDYIAGESIAYEFAKKELSSMGYDSSAVKELSEEEVAAFWESEHITADDSKQVWIFADYVYIKKDWKATIGSACLYGYDYIDENNDSRVLLVAYDAITGYVFVPTEEFVWKTIDAFLMSPYNSPLVSPPTFGCVHSLDRLWGYMEDGCDIENMLDFAGAAGKYAGDDYLVLFGYPGLDDGIAQMGGIDIDRIYEIIEILDKYGVSKEEKEYDGNEMICREYGFK